ncbi:hypothetical protein ACPPVO_17150 [Dactylosporangium sp. McL0621]|uniref:hypothetical protein n=1 Tax=Dactylosporangium sp. McL0621 TaxID=3415678 RepID=UPI003CE7F1D9
MIDLDHCPAGTCSGPAPLLRRPGVRLAIVVGLGLLAACPAAPPGAHVFARTAPAPVACRLVADVYHVLAAGPCPRG